MRDSGLEWVLIRPPRFTSQRRGQLRVLRPGDKGRVGGVSRHDLVRMLIDAAERPDYLHRRSSWAHSPGFPRVCRDRGRSGADCRDLGSLHHDRPSVDSRPISGYALLRAPASRPRSAIGFRRGVPLPHRHRERLRGVAPFAVSDGRVNTGSAGTRAADASAPGNHVLVGGSCQVRTRPSTDLLVRASRRPARVPGTPRPARWAAPTGVRRSSGRRRTGAGPGPG